MPILGTQNLFCPDTPPPAPQPSSRGPNTKHGPACTPFHRGQQVLGCVPQGHGISGPDEGQGVHTAPSQCRIGPCQPPAVAAAGAPSISQRRGLMPPATLGTRFDRCVVERPPWHGDCGRHRHRRCRHCAASAPGRRSRTEGIANGGMQGCPAVHLDLSRAPPVTVVGYRPTAVD